MSAAATTPPTKIPPTERLKEISFLAKYVAPYRQPFLWAFAGSCLSMSFGAMFPWLVGHLVDAAVPSLKEAETLPWHLGVDAIGLCLLGTLIVQAILTFFTSSTFQAVGERSVVALRSELFSRVVSLPMAFFGERRVGEISSRLSADLALIQDLVAFSVPQAIRQSVLMFFGLVAISLTSWRLSLVMACSLPPVILVTIWYGRKTRKAAREAQDCLAATATIVEETLQNIGSVKAYTNEGFETARYQGSLERFLAVVVPAARTRSALIAFIIVGIFGSITLVLWYGARLMERGQLSHGELTRFTLYTMLIGGSVASAADLFATVNRTAGASQRVRELLREPIEPTGVAAAASAQPVRLAGDVQFQDVTFAYPSRADVTVLDHLSLRAAPGERVALVGPSGAGKSTIVSLLLRFYDPAAGHLLLDGRPAASFPLAELRANMAIVPQEVMLFGGSIRANIGYGRPGASAEEIYAAAQRANCHEFIQRFPEGYETVVGERGVQLSGGQRQRIAIARALLKDPAILILDEATSSLDSESEHLIQEALRTLLEGRTAFIIAHRLSTIRQADRIYVIERGHATESGTHEELIERTGGTYRRLSELQFGV